MDHPNCKAELHLIYVGPNYFGPSREWRCDACDWSEGDDVVFCCYCNEPMGVCDCDERYCCSACGKRQCEGHDECPF